MLIFNSIIFTLLFITFVIKLTDEKERDIYRKVAYFSLTITTLFLAVWTFKNAFIFDKVIFEVSNIEMLFNLLILFFMWTKVKEDKFFSNLKKK
jgi:hypothetical protein